VQTVLGWTYSTGTNRGRTIRQNYEAQYDTLRAAAPAPTP
jgi:hypothetical protein